ncbi:hypothetical protein [Pseudomonas sp. CGJS7]|uniref:hypothetical protein n=1 Tax=Pseudomonas sp. CGJS7 TaxID=3109348 RepID=UPI003009177F
MRTIAATAFLLSLFPIGVIAATANVINQAEISMIVSGHARFGQAGRVEGISFDQESKIPIDVKALIRGKAAQWLIESESSSNAGFNATPEKVALTARIVGHRQTNGDVAIRIKSIHFGPLNPGVELKSENFTKPVYPSALASTNAAGTVYLLAQLSSQGEVLQVVPEQVNLYVMGEDARMREVRDLFASSAVLAAQRWKFEVKESTSVDSITVRIPIEYVAPGGRRLAYGQWETYMPGPRTNAPWLPSMQEGADEADTVASHSLQIIGERSARRQILGEG